MRKINLLFLSCILFAGKIVHAQDPQSAQPNNSAMFLNPAFAGASGEGRAFAGYENEWHKLSNGFQTYSFSYDQYVKALRGGLGITAFNDNAGTSLKTNAFDIIYSAHIPLFNNRIVLKPAIGGGFGRKFIDYSALQWGSQYNPSTGTFSNPSPVGNFKMSEDYFDLSSGVLIYSDRFYGGIAIHHLNQPNLSFLGSTDKTFMKQTFHFGYTFGRDSLKRFSISPNVIFAKQGPSIYKMIGVTAKYDHFLLGVNYQIHDAAFFSIGFQHRIFKFSYTYGYVLTDLTNKITGGIHQLSLIFWMNYSNKPNDILTLRPIAF